MGNVNVADFALFDHKAVLFEVPLVSHEPLPTGLTRSRTLNSHLIPQFCRNLLCPLTSLEKNWSLMLTTLSTLLATLAQTSWTPLHQSELKGRNPASHHGEMKIWGLRGGSGERQKENGGKANFLFHWLLQESKCVFSSIEQRQPDTITSPTHCQAWTQPNRQPNWSVKTGTRCNAADFYHLPIRLHPYLVFKTRFLSSCPTQSTYS